MDFRQLEAFCAIIDWGSFSEAAKRLYITQPTISNHLRMLEKELNTSLIKRTTKTLAITPDGRKFYEYAHNILSIRDKALSDFSRGSTHRIHIGVSSTPSICILPEIISEYKNLHADAYFEVFQTDSVGIINGLNSGTFDVGITGTPYSDEQFECISIYHDEMFLAMPDNEHYRTLYNAGDIDTLLMEPFILREKGSGTRRKTVSILESLGISESQLNISARMNDLNSVIAGITHGLGVSLLSKSVIDTINSDKILSIPIDSENPEMFRDYYLIYKKTVSDGYVTDFTDHILHK
jgi:DNA-binding transcriptional LysR family regulator